MTDNQDHARLSASGAHRWMACPGSVAAEAPYPRTSSIYAEEGTFAHDVAESILLDKPLPVIPEQYDADDMLAAVRQYVDYVESLDTMSSRNLIETRVYYDHIAPDGFGTADYLSYDPDSQHLHVVDYKHGKGVPVSAYRNKQLMLYASGATRYLNIRKTVQTISLHVVQPRAKNFDEYKLDMAELEQFEFEARDAAMAASKPDAPRIPGQTQCRWCAAKADCKALYDFTKQTILDDLDDDLFDTDPNMLTDEQKRAVLDNRQLIDTFLDAVEQDVFELLSKDEHFPGYKLIESQSRLKWTQEAKERLPDLIGDDAYQKKLISITEAKKRLSEDILQDITERPSGKPKLVPESHKSPAITVVDSEELFDN